MFEKLRVKQHMQVLDSQGRAVGTVDAVDDDRLKLTRAHSADAAHHSLAFDQIDRIEDDCIYLKQGTPIPVGLQT